MSDRELGYTVDELGIDQGGQYYGGDTPSFVNTYEQGYGGGRTNDQLRNLGVGIRQITVDVGDNIQDAINALTEVGGGVVTLLPGTHTPNYNINLTSSIYLRGQNAATSIIDFQSDSFSVRAHGEGIYSDGTVSVSNGDTTVTGSSTLWQANITAGQYIMLGGLWYPIAAVGSDTSLTIALPFAGVALSGATYDVAVPISDIKISDLTVKNSIGTALSVQFGTEIFITDVDIQSSATGLGVTKTAQISLRETDITACNSGATFTNVHFFIIEATGAIDTLVGAGWAFTTCTNAAMTALFIYNSTGDGATFTSCSDLVILGIFNENGGQGVELVSGNSNLAFDGCAFENNTSDGARLTATSDNCFFNSVSFHTNGGYGLNIVASSCDNNVVVGNNFTSNVTAAVSDSGTGTIFRGNVGVADSGGTGMDYRPGGTDVALADGGTGATLADPNADRILFWDDSAGAVTWLTASTGLAISTTNISLSHLGIQNLTDPNADRILFWDDSAGATAWLSLGNGLTITTTSIAVDSASETVDGIVEIGTVAEIEAGTDPARVIGIDQFAGSNFGERCVSIQVTDPNGDALTTGNGKAGFRVPSSMTGMNLIEADASVSTVSSSGAVTIMIRRSRRSSATARTDADMLSTAITIDQSEFDSEDATAEAVNGTNDDVQTGDHIYVDVDAAGTGVKGLIVGLMFRLP